MAPPDSPAGPGASPGAPGSLARLAAADALLTPSEVASLFRVDPKTVTRWAQAGKLSAVRTLGGHRRYRESEVRALLARSESPPASG